jgi:adenylate cyclase
MTPRQDMTTEPEPTEPDPRPGPEDLERAILGQEPEFNALEVAAATGVTLEEARRLWRALGFPEHGLENAYTDADTEALSTMISAVRADLIDFDLAVNLTRAVGQTMARLADWEVSTLVSRVDELASDPDSDEGRTGSALRLIEQIKDPFEDLLIYVWRRHLAAAVARVEALRSNEEDLNTVQLTVGFADIVSFTALSNRLTEERIGDLVELFESRCSDVVTVQGGRVIKSIGDSVLFVSEDPIGAYNIAEGIINVVGRDPRMPDIRLGLATGSVVMRLGDVFGPPVNLAARLTAVARRNRIIIDATTAALLPEDEFETRRLPARPVRGFGIVEPLTVRRA